MTNITQSLTTPPRRKPRTPCLGGALMNKLTQTEREAVQAAFNDPHWSAADITRVLNENGHQISAGTLRRHARGDCACE